MSDLGTAIDSADRAMYESKQQMRVMMKAEINPQISQVTQLQ